MAAFYQLYQNYGAELWLGLAFLVLILAAGLILLFLRLRQTLTAYRSLVTGVEGQDLEEILNYHIAQVEQAKAQVDQLTHVAQEMERGLQRSLQRVGMVRFNPFSDRGGDQSFSIVLADSQGDGVVITSLHSRTESRVYAKPLSRWGSEYALTEEEKEAIARAHKREEGDPGSELV
ncbi:MAG: DUF4446 family protein [Anaerolineae bacterium]